MKADAVDPKLLRYHVTFNKLYVPFLALSQLFTALYRIYISGTISYYLGVPRTFSIFFKQLNMALIFLAFALIGGKSFAINYKSVPFILVSGIMYVAVQEQLYVRAQIENGPFIFACYQVIIPALSTWGAIMLKFEGGTMLKYMSIAICLMAMVGRFVYDWVADTYGGKQFLGKFYIFMQLIFMSVGPMINKIVVKKNPKTSLFVIGFYIYCTGLVATSFIYVIKYNNYVLGVNSYKLTKESFPTFFTFEYVTLLINMTGIWSALIVTESFRYIVILYINKLGNISQVTLYSTLHGFFV